MQSSRCALIYMALFRVFLYLSNMRMLKDHQHSIYVQYGYPPGVQHNRLTVASIQQLWNEWEIQCLVLVSISLQVFLLFFAGFRKRYCSRVLSVLLWLAYLSADTMALFVLGHLTCVVRDDPRHQMVLFWAPFMLLHLGGQETITAFSMEDCALWKRHLLNLTTQVALAIYVVSKQWQGDKQLVAPMVLIFISGTAKYMERIWILGRAGSWGPISRPWGPLLGQKRLPRVRLGEQRAIQPLFSSDKKSGFHIEDVAHDIFYRSMGFFMNRTPKLYVNDDWWRWGRGTVTSSEERVNLAYKLAEIQLSLIYDYLYTKFGSLDGVLHRLTILVLNSTALALFVVHHKGGKRRSEAVKSNSGVADVAISYILLVGAVALEISSILIWLITSYWPYKVFPRGDHSPRIVVSILKRLRPAQGSNRLEWSGKLQQYNLTDEIIQEEKARKEYGWLKWIMWHMGIKQQDDATTKHVAISPEVKKVFLDKLRENYGRLNLASFRSEWATSSSSRFGAAQQEVRGILEGMDLVSSAFLWHFVTDICLLRDETPSKLRTCSQHLSNYIMHLVYKCDLMVDAEGCSLFEDYIRLMGKFCKDANYDKRDLLLRYRSDRFSHDPVRPAVGKAAKVAFLLNSEAAAADQWEMIAMVWLEMLCYIAMNCDHGFHAKQLSAGGEFLTHAKMIMFQLVVPDEQLMRM
ncbi:uncharacterized protein LOC119343684 [Triticum dicoccoides]|uniref:uncharacterized protein LOC119343684 n=1 Tax=Triticum dicoccoides TaxID=85692 RepID=UPI00188FDB07|nr:uncharacterized protein LOC119343684 [Triticum dicoccoides]